MMRLGLALLVLVILGSAYGEEENPNEMCHTQAFMACQNPTTERAFHSLNGLPDEAFLKENCDNMVQQLDCLLEEDKTCPLSTIMMETAKGFRGFIGVKNLVVEMCDENSALRKDYLDSKDCLTTHERDISVDVRKSDSIFRKFKGHYDLHNPEFREVEEALICVEISFMLGEIQNAIERHCGTSALNTVRTMYNHVMSSEPYNCAADDENFQLYSEMLESFRSEEESVAINSVE